MLEKLPNPAAATGWCNLQRQDSRSIGYVPTMGALHEGHISLFLRARRDCDRVCVSIFVNPLQFNDPTDYDRYPRDREADYALIEQAGCDMVFEGTLGDFFPEAGSPDQIRPRDAGRYKHGLEGETRPGHLDGVATIVERLFRTVGSCRAYFGAKDFQQTLVVKDLAAELGYPEIVVCPTLREADGLAMSSRNRLLADSQRPGALRLSRALFAARDLWRQGERDAEVLRAAMWRIMSTPGVEPEYADLRDPENWSAGSPAGNMQRARALVAAKVGRIRLIDNLKLD